MHTDTASRAVCLNRISIKAMTQDQIILLLDLKASKERGAASMSCNQRLLVAGELVTLGLIEHYSVGFRISGAGLKTLEKIREKQ